MCVCVCVCRGVSIIARVVDDKSDTQQLLSHSRCFSIETQVSCLRSFRLHKNTALASASIDDIVLHPLLLLPHMVTLVLCVKGHDNLDQKEVKPYHIYIVRILRRKKYQAKKDKKDEGA